jgi:hypothetical protein
MPLPRAASFLPAGPKGKRIGQLEDIEPLTFENVPLMVVPSEVTIVIHATRMSASITAYSTAVGPSSLLRKRETRVMKICI